MFAAHVAIVIGIFNDIVDFIPPGLVLSVAAGCVENRKYWDAYVKEFIGSMMMIAFTFSAGNGSVPDLGKLRGHFMPSV
jgi:hypothetical protein